MIISAPGKLMLLGEHAVVYGHPCIATAVDSRLKVSLEESNDKKVMIEAPQVKDTRFVEEAIVKGCQEWGIRHTGLHIKTESPFSGKYGFGSSSAVTVATLQALAQLFSLHISKRELFNIAYKVILSVQKVGSGYDAAAAIYGGTIFYINGKGTTIEELCLGRNLPLVIGYTGFKSNSVEIVNEVAQKRKEYPQKVDRIFEAIGKLVRETKEFMKEGDWERVGKNMDYNQEFLRDLGVSSQILEDMILAAKKAGAWGAKLSGAGRGDCMIALAPDDKREEIESALEKVGGEVVRIASNARGVGIETTDDQEELFIVVDKNDNVIGYKTRYECHHDKSLIHRTVGVVVFDDRGRALLQKRSQTKDMGPGLWGISAAGHVTKGQSYTEAASRELEEELGLKLPVEYKTKHIVKSQDETEIGALYVTRSNGPFKPNPSEIDQVEFVDKKELPRKMLSRQIQLTQWAYESLKAVGFLP